MSAETYEPVEDFPLMPDEEAAAAKEAAEKEEERRAGALSAVVGSLSRIVTGRVADRVQIEERWMTDLYQYHGQLSPEAAKLLEKANAVSTMIVNETRTKTNTMSARLSDLLFPTDDTNWSISPTPLPRLTKTAAKVERDLKKMRDQMSAQQQAQAAPPQGAPQGQAPAGIAAPTEPAPGAAATPQQAVDAGPPAPPQNPSDLVKQIDIYAARLADVQNQRAVAQQATDNMTMQIEDQLTDCQYAAEARKVIEDACKLGTGIMKGPVLDVGVGAYWDTDEAGNSALVAGDMATSVSMRRVDPWLFFPDMTRQEVSPQDGVFERHPMTESDLRKLARTPGFDRKAIRELLKGRSTSALPDHFNELASINLPSATNVAALPYDVWEYHGPISGDDLAAVAEALMRVDLLVDSSERWPDDVRQMRGAQQQDTGEIDENGNPVLIDIPLEITDFEVDPLSEVQVVVWFCGASLLKFELSPNERGDLPYSIYCIEPDEACPFGYGVPYMIRNTQDALNAIVRMMLDNGGVAAGPQVIINQEKIGPADNSNDYSFHPRKTWKFKAEVTKDEVPLQEININSHLGELMKLAEFMLKLMDDEAAIPLIAAGEQGSTQTKTMGGMTILMNAANIIFKRAVKRFDDDMTTPNIRRLYDWNMTYSRDQSIKGDCQIDARGSSVLLVRELVANNLMMIAEKFGNHPVFGPMLKSAAVLRSIFRAHGMPVDESVYSDEELERIMAAASANAQQTDPIELEKLAVKREEIQARVEIANMTAASAKDLAMTNRETEMMKLAGQMNVSLDKVQAQLEGMREQAAHKERMFQAEIGAQSTPNVHPMGGGMI